MAKYTPAEIREITDIETVLAAYARTQLWTGFYMESEESSPDPLDSHADADDIPESVMAEMREDVVNFCREVRRTLRNYAVRPGLDAEQLGHDFALTRNRHGAGFWDRGYGRLGDALTDLAHPYGESTMEGYPDAESGNVRIELLG